MARRSESISQRIALREQSSRGDDKDGMQRRERSRGKGKKKKAELLLFLFYTSFRRHRPFYSLSSDYVHCAFRSCFHTFVLFFLIAE